MLALFCYFQLRVPGEREHFLINPFGLHYSEVTAANLVKIDLAGNIVDPGTTQLGVNKAGYVIHSAIHEGRKDIKCIIHLHSQYGAAVSAMKCGLLPICQEALVVSKINKSFLIVIITWFLFSRLARYRIISIVALLVMKLRKPR